MSVFFSLFFFEIRTPSSQITEQNSTTFCQMFRSEPDSKRTPKIVCPYTTDLYKYFPDTVPPIHVVSYHVATDKPPPPKMATSSGLFLTTIYNQLQLAEKKNVARYWSINTAATAVPLSAHPSPLVITTRLAAAILGGVVRRRCSAGPVLPLWKQHSH